MDNNGLICAWLLDGKGAGRELDWEALHQTEPGPGELLWLHFDYSHPAVRDWLREQSDLSALTAMALSQHDPRPRVVPSDGGLMVFLRAVNLNPGAEADDMVSARIWAGERRVITLRHRRLVSMDDLRAAIMDGRGPASAGEFLAMMVNGILDRIEPVVELIDEHIDELEEPKPAASIPEQRRQLAEIRRQAIALRRFLAPQREALNRLAIDSSGLFREQDQLQMREESDRQTRILSASVPRWRRNRWPA
jgi:zinc transporter